MTAEQLHADNQRCGQTTARMIKKENAEPSFQSCLAWLWHSANTKLSSGDRDGHHCLLPLLHRSAGAVGRLVPLELFYSFVSP